MKISVVMPILVPTSFLRAMTEFCIKTLRAHADNKFELVVVEAVHDHFDPEKKNLLGERENSYGTMLANPFRIDKYIRFPQKIGQVKEINAGIDAASGEFIVFTGNDLIVPPHWDTELLIPFEKYPDCGASSLSAFEPGSVIGPDQKLNRIVEGMYSPFTMFRKGWRYDEGYQRIYQDSDLIMRLYKAGLRAYRNCFSHVHHLNRMTNDSVDTAEHNRILAIDERRFYETWGDSPLMMFAMIRYGQYTYGKEHFSFTNPINLHYDPKAPR